MTTTFYRFLLDAGPSGLVRRTQSPETGERFAYVNTGEWVEDGSLLRLFLDPGDIELVEIPEAEARTVAVGYGVELGGEPTRETALGDSPDDGA